MSPTPSSSERGDLRPRGSRRLNDAALAFPVESWIQDGTDRLRLLRGGVIVATLGFGVVVWFLRRPDQLLHPYVWVEEYQILNRYQAQGLLHSILAPVQGYFVWPTSFTVGLASSISFLHVPLIDYWASTAWFVATLCLILIPASRIRLRWRVGLVVLLVLVPTNPEVFGIAEYAFWWTTLWPLISIFWSKDYWWLRIPALVIGGMSSLAGAAIFVPYAFLFVTTRRRRYAIGSAILAVTLVVQTVAYLTSSRSARTPLHPRNVVLQELRNFSYYAFTWLTPTDTAFLAFTGACMLLVIVAVVLYAAAQGRSRDADLLIALVLGLLVMGVLSAIPAPLLSDPILAGPRYYFLPYVILGWVLLIIVLTSTQWARIAATLVILMSLPALSQTFSRHDDRFSWSRQLARCEKTTRPFSVPVQFDGNRADLWKRLLVITPQTCRSLGYH